MRLFTNTTSTTRHNGGLTPVRLPGTAKLYEHHTPGELAGMRSSGAEGEAQYQNLRADWIAAGKPRGSVASIFSAQRYEQLTPDQHAQLRSIGSAGEARYQELRGSWEERGCPSTVRPTTGGDAA